MRSKFDEQLATLKEELTQMGSLCEEVIAFAADALKTGDVETASKIPPIDSEIDKMEREIESLCLNMLLRQQPVARDLRQISAALKMITDMERIGDQASDISEIITFMSKDNVKFDLSVIEKMASESSYMVTCSVDAYVKQDLLMAQRTIDHDDIVDDLFNNAKKQLIDMIAKDPADGEYALDILQIAKYFERIADHATNIAEWVEFSITGSHETLQQ